MSSLTVYLCEGERGGGRGGEGGREGRREGGEGGRGGREGERGRGRKEGEREGRRERDSVSIIFTNKHTKAEMTFPSADKDRLILIACLNCSPYINTTKSLQL